MSLRDFPWMGREHRGWNRAWSALHARTSSFDGWQYMGTDARGHCFRLRDNSGDGKPHRYEFVTVRWDDFEGATPS